MKNKFVDLDGNLSKIKERLDKNKSAENYASELEEIEVKITRLGAINLVAMEEFEQETERKALLDEQHKELTEALETLEKAITKIDKETELPSKIPLINLIKVYLNHSLNFLEEVMLNWSCLEMIC